MAVPSQFSRDPFSRLNSILEAENQPRGSIRDACRAVEECLASNRDNLRGFFDKPFSNLVKRVFGYGNQAGSWLNTVKGSDEDARALVDLLAPDGKLFAAMAQADSDHLVQYIFPTERLPAHTQELLKELQGYGRRLLDTWPQYRGRIRADPAGRPQVYLNLFEYFMFWTAFYVLRGSASDESKNDARAQLGCGSSNVIRNGFRNVGSALTGSGKYGRSAGPLQSDPYYCLLRTYLEYFLPRSSGGGASSAAAARATSGAGGPTAVASATSGLGYGTGLRGGGVGGGAIGRASYKPTLTAAAAGADSPGAVLLSILVEFWLTDLAEPLPSAGTDRVTGAVMPGGMAMPVGSLGVGAFVQPGSAAGMITGGASPTAVSVATPPSVRMLTYQPPSEELVEGLVTLARYVHVMEPDTHSWQKGAGRSPAAGASPPSVATGAIATVRPTVAGTGWHISGGGGASPQRPPVQLQPAQAGRPPWLPETPVKTPPPPPQRLLTPPGVLLVHGSSASPAVQAVSRKVYRQLRRAFSLWPPGSPISLAPLISLWLSVIAPWCPTAAHKCKAVTVDSAAGTNSGPGHSSGSAYGGAHGSAPGGSGGGLRHLHVTHHDGGGTLGITASKLHLGGGGARDRDRELTGPTCRDVLSQYKYTPAWRGHVLAHLPFYLQLLPLFVMLSLSRLKYHPDVALSDLDRVLAVMAAAGPELLRELRSAEAALNDFLRPAVAGGRRRSEGEYGEMVPWWLEQAQDFEAAAAVGSSPPGAVQPDVTGRLFTVDSGSAAYTMCLLLRSAETLGQPELVAAVRQSSTAVVPLDCILPAVAEEQGHAGDTGGSADVRCYPKAGRWGAHLSSLMAKDPKLVNPLRLWTELYRGPDRRHDPLHCPIGSHEVAWLVRWLVRVSTRWNASLGLDTPYRPGEEDEDPPEHLGQQVLLWARKRAFRVNLRFLGEKVMIGWLLLLFFLTCFLVRAFFSGSGGDGAVAPSGHTIIPAGGGHGAYGDLGNPNAYGNSPYGRVEYSLQEGFASGREWRYPGGDGNRVGHGQGHHVADQRIYEAPMYNMHDTYRGGHDVGRSESVLGDERKADGAYTFGA